MYKVVFSNASSDWAAKESDLATPMTLVDVYFVRRDSIQPTRRRLLWKMLAGRQVQNAKLALSATALDVCYFGCVKIPSGLMTYKEGASADMILIKGNPL